MSGEDDDEVPLYVGNRPVSAAESRAARSAAAAAAGHSDDDPDELTAEELGRELARLRQGVGRPTVTSAVVDANERRVASVQQAALAGAGAVLGDKRGVVPRDAHGTSTAGSSAQNSARRGSESAAVGGGGRAAALEEEVRALQNTVRHQERGLQQLTAESEKQRKVIAGLTAKLDKEAAENKSLRSELKIAEALAATHKKEAAAAVRSQAKSGSSGGGGAGADASSDLRLKRALEELEQAKAQLAARPEPSTEDAKLREQVTDLTTKVNDLLNVVRRQNKMIDVLKRQKLHLEASRLLQLTEQEFARVLEMNEA